MAYSYKWRGPDIVTSDLHLYLDAASLNSYYDSFNTTTWKDISGNGYDASITASYIPASQSFQFNGLNQTVNISNAATLANRNQTTINVLLKPISITSSLNVAIYYEETSKPAFSKISLQQYNNTIRLKWRDVENDPTGSFGILASTEFLTTDTFYYVSAVYDAVNNQQAIYVNGVLNASSAESVSNLGTSITNGITLGSAAELPESFSQCYIGAVHIYGRALSQTEIQQNYVAIQDRILPANASLVDTLMTSYEARIIASGSQIECLPCIRAVLDELNQL